MNKEEKIEIIEEKIKEKKELINSFDEKIEGFKKEVNIIVVSQQIANNELDNLEKYLLDVIEKEGSKKEEKLK